MRSSPSRVGWLEWIFHGLGVEVLRTDGRRTWHDKSTDYDSGTYTVRMTNGQLKWMVEEEDLRHYRAGNIIQGPGHCQRMRKDT